MILLLILCLCIFGIVLFGLYHLNKMNAFIRQSDQDVSQNADTKLSSAKQEIETNMEEDKALLTRKLNTAEDGLQKEIGVAKSQLEKEMDEININLRQSLNKHQKNIEKKVKTGNLDVSGDATFSKKTTAHAIHAKSIQGTSIKGTTLEGKKLQGDEIQGNKVNTNLLKTKILNTSHIGNHTLRIGRHLDAKRNWVNDNKKGTLFLGYYNGKTLLGNKTSKGIEIAKAAPANSVISLNPLKVGGNLDVNGAIRSTEMVQANKGIAVKGKLECDTVRSKQNSVFDKDVLAGRVRPKNHVSAYKRWVNDGRRGTLFLGWYNGKTVVGNHVHGGGTLAKTAPANSVIVTNPMKVHKDVEVKGNLKTKSLEIDGIVLTKADLEKLKSTSSQALTQ